jgi:hypothetical protein
VLCVVVLLLVASDPLSFFLMLDAPTSDPVLQTTSIGRCVGMPYVLGPVPGVDVMAKRPQGLLDVGGSFRFRADGGAAFLRSWH